MRRTLGSLTVVALITSACGATQRVTATHSSATSPTATPTVAPALRCAPSAQPAPPSTLAGTIAIERSGRTTTAGTESDLDVISTHGTILSHTTFSDSFDPVRVGVGAHGVYLYDGTAGKMERLEANGELRFLNSAPAGGQSAVTAAAESRDGACWAYSVVVSPDTMGGDVTSQIYVGTLGADPRMVATLTRSNNEGGGYRVLRWDTAGVLLGTDPQNVGGAGPFISEGYALGSVVRLDVGTGKVLSAVCGGQGGFGDVAADGTVACRSGSDVIIVHPDGSTTTISNSQRTGQIAFVAGSSVVAYCTTSGYVGPTPTWQDTLYTATLTGTQATQRRLVAADTPFCDGELAFNKVVDENTLAEVTRTLDESSLVLVNLTTGLVTPVASAVRIDGVL